MLQFEIFLHIEIEILYTKLKFSQFKYNENITLEKSKYTWTADKCDLVEYLRPLILDNCINNGNVTIKEIMLFFGKMLNTDLKNYNSIMNDILSRYDNPNEKHSRTKFLNRLVEILNKHLNSLDTKQIRNK